jgi:hypothetical protein
MLLFTFRVAIHPESSSEDDTDVKAMWKAKISQIRRQGRSYFVKIAWFYSPSDMLAQLKGNKDMCGIFFFRFISHQPSFFSLASRATFILENSFYQTMSKFCLQAPSLVGPNLPINVEITPLKAGNYFSAYCEILYFAQESGRPRELDNCYFYR